MARCLTDVEINEMVEKVNDAFNASESEKPEITMFRKMHDKLEEKIKSSTSLDLEFVMDGYTKSLITNFQNMFPMNVSDFTEEELSEAVADKLIRKVSMLGYSIYKNEKVKLTEKGKKHFLKFITE